LGKRCAKEGLDVRISFISNYKKIVTLCDIDSRYEQWKWTTTIEGQLMLDNYKQRRNISQWGFLLVTDLLLSSIIVLV
jgi:hypothetical protein